MRDGIFLVLLTNNENLVFVLWVPGLFRQLDRCYSEARRGGNSDQAAR